MLFAGSQEAKQKVTGRSRHWVSRTLHYTDKPAVIKIITITSERKDRQIT
jgi:hypothetical protein